LDGAKAGITRNDAGKIVGISGFGNLNAYGARLVIQSVSEITPHEIDYSKTNAITKGDAFQESGGDPVAAARHAALAFGPNSAPGAKIARAADAWGKEGDHNGVEVTSGGQNEESSKAEGKSTQDSPDGVLFNCAFDPSRNKGDSLSRAMVHLGELIADLRNPASGQENASVYDLESFAWVTTALNAVASGQKTLTLPGGYLLWNAGWAPADRDKNLNDAVNGFLGTEELISR
jgi:hypothetical protein